MSRHSNLIGAALLAASAIAPIAGASAQAPDAAKGKTVFARCAICHSFDAQKKLGPSLAGVMGRKAGVLPDFNYSPAMKKSGIVWNAKSLDGYLAKPMATIPGNKMAFAGISNPADRASLIAYIAQASKGK